MRIISTSTLKAFSEQPRHQAAMDVIKTWIAVTKAAAWATPLDVKADYPQTDILQGGRVIFDLGGNKYRLVAHIRYDVKIVFIRFIGTHAQYEKIDANSI